MLNKDFHSIIELVEYFKTEKKCLLHLQQIRWGNNIISPFDPESKVYKCKRGYKCKNTGKYFNPKTGTIFESSKVSLKKWFLAIWLITCHKKGISSIQLSKDIKVTQKTAWFMLHRIRKCFEADNDADMSGEIEVDETYVGGKNKNRHKDKKFKYSQGRSFKDKTPVFGVLQRGGKLCAYVVPDVKGNTLKTIIYDKVQFKTKVKIKSKTEIKETIIHSDEWIAYSGLHKEYDHRVVYHSKGIYGTENSNTNTIEGAWSILKRSIIGIYHFTSKRHLQRYIDEFVFRYNCKDLEESNKFTSLLNNIQCRLKYKDLIYG